MGLGALGVLTEIEVQLVERHKLRRRMWAERHDTLLGARDSLWAENRNFEFFYVPFSGFSFGLTHNIVDAEDTPRAPDTSDTEVMQLKALRDRVALVAGFAEISAIARDSQQPNCRRCGGRKLAASVQPTQCNV